MKRIMAQVERVAASESRVCIFGETGKTVILRFDARSRTWKSF